MKPQIAVDKQVIAQPLKEEASPPPKIQGFVAPAAEEDLVEAKPSQEPVKQPAVEPPAKKEKQPKQERSHVAPSKTRPGSAGGGRPSSAERSRPAIAEGEDASKEKDRPGSAGRNRNKSVKPSVWLSDKSTIKSDQKSLKVRPPLRATCASAYSQGSA